MCTSLYAVLITSQVECQYVHMGFPQQAKGTALGVLSHQLAYRTLFAPVRLGD
jgi:hypothetical protein